MNRSRRRRGAVGGAGTGGSSGGAAGLARHATAERPRGGKISGRDGARERGAGQSRVQQNRAKRRNGGESKAKQSKARAFGSSSLSLCVCFPTRCFHSFFVACSSAPFLLFVISLRPVLRVGGMGARVAGCTVFLAVSFCSPNAFCRRQARASTFFLSPLPPVLESTFCCNDTFSTSLTIDRVLTHTSAALSQSTSPSPMQDERPKF